MLQPTVLLQKFHPHLLRFIILITYLDPSTQETSLELLSLYQQQEELYRVKKCCIVMSKQKAAERAAASEAEKDRKKREEEERKLAAEWCVLLIHRYSTMKNRR